MMDEMTGVGFSVSFFGFPVLIMGSTIAPFLFNTVPMKCEVAQSRQHIIKSLVFKLEASSLIWRLAGCRVRKLNFVL
jgi:hypothetical protein